MFLKVNFSVIAKTVRGEQDEAVIQIRIITGNLHPPKLAKLLYRGKVSENALENSLIFDENDQLLLFAAEDKDGGGPISFVINERWV